MIPFRKDKDYCSQACYYRRNGEKIRKICIQCKKEYTVTYKRKDSIFCSRKCHGDSLKGKINQALYDARVLMKGENHPMYGKHLSEETKRKISENHADMSGEKSSSWKGDDVGYSGIHDWIVKIAGKPQRCDKCGAINPQRYEWANKSRTYKRDITDWIRLCVFCHRKADYHKLPL